MAEGCPLLAKPVADPLALLIGQPRFAALAPAIPGAVTPTGPITSLGSRRAAVGVATFTFPAPLTRELPARAGRGSIPGPTVGPLLLTALGAIETLLAIAVSTTATLLISPLGTIEALLLVASIDAVPSLAPINAVATPDATILPRLGAADLRSTFAAAELTAFWPARRLALEGSTGGRACPLGSAAPAGTGSTWRLWPPGRTTTIAARTRLRHCRRHACRQ